MTPEELKETQMELREERIYICKAEGVSDEEIQKIIERYPDLYGRD